MIFISRRRLITARFSVELESGAQLYHEWRDWPDGGTYAAGPSVTIDGTGTVYASWVAIGAVTATDWLDVVITATIGSGDGSWNLEITEATGATQTWTGLPATPLSELNWIGFVANADAEARIWVDEIEIR